MDELLTSTACTLPTLDRPLRLAEFDALFAHATSVEYVGHAALIRLAGPATLKDHVLDLAARETQCCSFFTFNVDGSDAEVALTITAPAEHQLIVSAIAARAKEMAR